jgi:hypothetical protein
MTLTIRKIRESGKKIMHSKFNIRPCLISLLAAGIILPVAICVVLGVGTLLSAMGDSAGGLVLQRICLALAILWGIDLISLLFVQGIVFLFSDHKKTDNSDEK